jgi:hypothetical protein
LEWIVIMCIFALRKREVGGNGEKERGVKKKSKKIWGREKSPYLCTPLERETGKKGAIPGGP